ncbi:hypothetical protein [Polymorphospora sp. NPDC050346]|uniref:hypothetical protein n=1 Tax=Polymorphospora sp. NPDC050346 TaxID=3155780 RepID=UPI0033D5DB61
MIDDRDLDQLAVLDPVRRREPDAEEWSRANAHVERILAGTAEAVPVVRRRGRRLAVGLAGAAVAAAALVAVPSLLPSGGGNAYASWTPEPQMLSAARALPVARACARSMERDPAVFTSDVLLAEQRGQATLAIVKMSGATVVECLSLEPGRATAAMLLADATTGPRQPGAARITIESMSSLGSGDSQYSNVVGRIDPAVTGVELALPDGRRIQASTNLGWWAAWWPGPEGGETDSITIGVRTASGWQWHKQDALYD